MASGSYVQSPAGPVFRLKAYMPDRFGMFSFDDDYSDPDELLSRFEAETCNGCDYYFESYKDDNPCTEDADGNPAASVTYSSRCSCRRENIESVRWPCAAGEDDPRNRACEASSGTLPPMGFSVDITPVNGVSVDASAWLQKADPLTGKVSKRYRSINCYDTNLICWGNEISDPQTLPEIVITYSDASCNADLLEPPEFINNIAMVRATETDLSLSSKELVIGSSFDAALLLHANHQPEAYLLLRASGHRTADGFILAGLKSHRHDDIDGFITEADGRGRCWFLTYADATPDADNGLMAALLGQIDYPTAPGSCSSPALS